MQLDPRMMQAMQKLQEVQQKVAETQERMASMTVTEEVAEGRVRATATGEGKLQKIELDMEQLKDEEKEVVEDLVLSCVNKAIDTAKRTADAEMQKATEGMMPNIPGLNL